MSRRTDKENSSSSRHVGSLIDQQLLLKKQKTRTANSSHHLVRRQKHGVTVVKRVYRSVIHYGSFVGTSSGTIPADQGSLFVHQLIYRRHLRDKSCHIANIIKRNHTKRTAGEHERDDLPRLELSEASSQFLQVNRTFRVHPELHEIHVSFTPRKKVAVVLKWTHEDDGS